MIILNTYLSENDSKSGILHKEIDFQLTSQCYEEKFHILNLIENSKNDYHEHACIQSPSENTTFNEYINNDDINVPQIREIMNTDGSNGSEFVEYPLHNTENPPFKMNCVYKMNVANLMTFLYSMFIHHLLCIYTPKTCKSGS